jgi:hypothetical protein
MASEVTLDFKKARPIPKAKSGKVSLDFSKAKPAAGYQSARELERKAMDPASQYVPSEGGVTPTPNMAGRVMNVAAPKLVGMAPSLGGTAGGLIGTALAGPLGGPIGAYEGGVEGEAYRQRVTGEKPSGKNLIKEGAIQAAWEIPGIAVKGATSALKAMGVSEKLMNFALRTGEDVKTGVNPGRALDAAKIRAWTARQLYDKVSTYSAGLQKQLGSVIEQAQKMGAKGVRPINAINEVIDREIETARRGLNQPLEQGLEGLKSYAKDVYTKMGEEFSGGLRNLPVREAEIADLTKAVDYKRAIGDFTNWGARAIDSSEKAVFQGVQDTRRAIYGTLNRDIRKAIEESGAPGAKALAKRAHDLGSQLLDLYEAKGALGQAIKHSTETAHTAYQAISNSMRNVGMARAVIEGVERAGPVVSGLAQGAKNILGII